MKSKQYGCVLLIAILLAAVGCSSKSLDKRSISPVSQGSHLEAIILDDSLDTDDREKAIDQLKQRGEWKRLVNVLPPKGEYGGITLDVIDALAEIGCVEAIPYLENLRNTDELVSGEFWISLDNDIESLKRLKEAKSAP